MWTTRLLLESQEHGSSVFLTLTYSDAKLPEDGSLQKRHYQLFLKRLRSSISPREIRFYLVGEYGGLGGRPHYHVVLFGYGEGLRSGLLRVEGSWLQHTSEEKELLRCWSLGNIHVASVTEASISYACKHITKGLRNDAEFVACDIVPARVAEFARMSLRPAIGLSSLERFEDAFQGSSAGALSLFMLGGDAPSVVRFERSFMPLGRYLRGKLRDRLGLDEGTSRESRKSFQMELRARRNDLGAAGMRSLRRVHAAKAELALNIQKSRSKL